MNLGDLSLSALRKLPPRLRERIKFYFGAAGHTRSIVDAWRARRLARTWRRPELIVPDVQQIIDAVGRRSLDDSLVMDFGCGLLLADAFVYAMLGAREVHAVDSARLLQSREFRAYAARNDWRRFADVVSERRGQRATDAWFQNLSDALHDPGARWFQRLGIRYLAPFDVLTDDLPARDYDLIASRSTLEHLPVDLARPIVTRLAEIVKPGGAMYHYIHLADHRDIERHPYGLLSAGDDFSPSQHDVRGNGMRASDWRALFESLDFTWSETMHSDDVDLFPKNLSARFQPYDREDLLINHYIVCGHRASGSYR